MSVDKLQSLINDMEPQEAVSALSIIIKNLFPLLDEDVRIRFVMNLIGDSGDDKISSLVHLWLAECMDEGVDPTKMCQTLVEKVAQSRQLSAVTDPEILVLFESWLEELEGEVIAFANKTNSSDPMDLAEGLGLSRSGADFLVAKLKREGKI
jgi:hypothetical protein